MRRTVCLLAALLVLPSLGSDSPKEYDGAMQDDELQGTWQIAGSSRICLQTFRGNTWVYTQEGQVVEEGTFKADQILKLALLDETMVNGQKENYIYRIEGDTLWTAFRRDRERPKSFDEAILVTTEWKRVKK